MFQSRLDAAATAISAHLDGVMDAFEDVPVTQAMRYASAGGKRLRAFLVLESARLHGVAQEQAVWPASAIEVMHAYSLVHDDLPCMDNDDLRRGRATVHIKWNEATAILAGDALQALAFELVSRPDIGSPEVRAALALGLARASGAQGMVLGQALDMEAETAPAPLDMTQIVRLQSGKTGALIEWAATAGAVMAGQDPRPLQQYAQALGLAFQIVDDILDISGDEATAGKRLNKDARAGKATFVSLLGLKAAQDRAAGLVEDAAAALSCYGDRAQTLQQAARFVISRGH